ncbi:hypothetical protein DL93DRAFT_2234229 [Clavulina sp. PMI_390]|nr:hypothetical protein DL93DRAFT_2234229 [Clavulina sp. PMI_390]
MQEPVPQMPQVEETAEGLEALPHWHLTRRYDGCTPCRKSRKACSNRTPPGGSPAPPSCLLCAKRKILCFWDPAFSRSGQAKTKNTYPFVLAERPDRSVVLHDVVSAAAPSDQGFNGPDFLYQSILPPSPMVGRSPHSINLTTPLDMCTLLPSAPEVNMISFRGSGDLEVPIEDAFAHYRLINVIDPPLPLGGVIVDVLTFQCTTNVYMPFCGAFNSAITAMGLVLSGGGAVADHLRFKVARGHAENALEQLMILTSLDHSLGDPFALATLVSLVVWRLKNAQHGRKTGRTFEVPLLDLLPTLLQHARETKPDCGIIKSANVLHQFLILSYDFGGCIKIDM